MSFAAPNHWLLPLIADGGISSRLARELPAGVPSAEALNLSHPERVQAIHEQFAAAGAKLHRTNTRWAGRAALPSPELVERTEAVNNSASALLRAAIGADGLMMGAIGEIAPQGAGAGGGGATIAERERSYSEQIVFLSDTGVTFFLLEHFARVEEVLRVVRIAKNASDAPVLAQMRFDPSGRSADGLDCAAAAGELMRGGAAALGISCGPAPREWPAILEALRATGLPISVMLGVAEPGAPHPYPGAPEMTPEAFAEVLAPLAKQGVAILGGCCGAGPDHIRALSAKMAGAASGSTTPAGEREK